jgi:hypothetical protein
MSKRSVLVVILGLTACLWYTFGTVIADQPGDRAGSPAGAQLVPAAGTASPTADVGAQPLEPLNKIRPDLKAPIPLPPGGAMPAPQGQPDSGVPSPAEESLQMDVGNILPVPPDAPHYEFYVDTETGAASGGPRDGSACMPAGGICGPIVYKNLVQEYYNYYTSSSAPVLDDITLAGTERDLCSLAAVTYGVNGTYTVTLEFWTDCPVTIGAVLLGGPFTSPELPAGRSTTTFALPGIHVPPTFYIKSVYTLVTASAAGPLLTEIAEVGWTNDYFFRIEGTPLACSRLWYGSAPWAGFGYQLSASGTAVGKCCYNDCAACADTTYGDCMQRPGNPEFLLGTSCAELPHCGKGACCLTTGACVADKTEAECAALPNFLNWTLGADCTAHGIIKAADCSGVPANDECANATVLSGSCLTIAFDNRNATYTTYTDDTVSCLHDPDDPNNDVAITNDVWYFYPIPTTYDGNPINQAQVLISTLGSSFDSVLTVYAKNKTASPAWPCGNPNAITCADLDVIRNNEVGCNDDIVGLTTTTFSPNHEQIQDSFVTITCDGSTEVGSGPLPGGCLLIRIGSLNQTGGQGGPGFLNIDLIPIDPDPYYASEGVCCLATGGAVLTSSQGGCSSLGGYWRNNTDFYEDGTTTGTGFETKAPGSCHGAFGSCQVGQYCGNPVVLNEIINPDDPIPPYPPVWTGDVYQVTYFKFVPRAYRAGDPGYPGTDPHYAITIDTCGSDFDTVLTVYKGLDSGGAFLDSGDCDEGSIVERNDDCSIDTPGAEGRVSCAGLYTTTSCVCLTVGAGRDLEANGGTYYLAVGKKDTRTGAGLPRPMGIDPVPNYPNAEAAALTLRIDDGWADCASCAKNCCKGDMDGNSVLDGRDIQGFINVLCGAVLPCVEASWCRANMNSDSLVDLGDIPAFVNALLVPWLCDFADYCNITGYCQAPDQTGGIISDYNQNTRMADNFVSLTGGEVTRVCWWGFNAFRAGSTWGTCTIAIPPDDFAIRFYANVDNHPGSVIASFAGITAASSYNLTKTATGRQIIGADEYKYEAQIPAVAVEAGDCIWLEIVNNTGTANCWWLWEASSGGDDRAAQYQYGFYHSVAGAASAFCLNIPIWDKGCVQYCEAICPSGHVAEGEPECGPGYVDGYNAGCNMAPGTEQFTDVQCGQTICGTSGVWDSATPGFVDRDTDWYKLVVTGTGGAESHVTISVFAEFTALAGFAEYQTGAPHDGDCANLSGYITPYASGRCTNLIVDTWFTPGTYYIFVAPDFSDPFYPECGAKYNLTVQCTACPTYTCTLPTSECPSGAGHTPEGETCGAVTDDGCNVTPAVFRAMNCGEKVCGTAWADAGKRDTDWYQFSVTSPKKVTAQLTSEFPGMVRILQVNDCSAVPPDVTVFSTAYSANCTAGSAISILSPGTYVVYVAPADASGAIYHCIRCTDPWTHYDLHLTCEDATACQQGTYCLDYHTSPLQVASDNPAGTLYKAADNFKPNASGSITHVCWWGITAHYVSGYEPCTMTANNFNIAFYTNNNAVDNPAATPFASRAVGNVVGVASGETWTSGAGFVYPIYLWQADIAAVDVTANTEYWMAIWSTLGPDCIFMFSANRDDAGGDDLSVQWNGTSWTRNWYDLSWCVNVACNSAVWGRQPVNDACTGSIDITANINGPSVVGNSTWATQALNDPTLSCYVVGGQAQKGKKTLWYWFTAPPGGNVTVNLCSSSTPFDYSLMALYSTTSHTTCASRVERFCNVNSCAGAHYSTITATGLTPGGQYLVQVGNTRDSGFSPGPFVLTITSP